MKSVSALLAIDQGTTGSRAFLYDVRGRVLAAAYREIRCRYLHPGWVSQDPQELVASVRWVTARALAQAGRSVRVEAVGITNQRETTVLWDRRTGRPVHEAVVWQCRRSAGICEALAKSGRSGLFRRKTGLVLDPYFSGTKLTWIFRHRKDLARRARRGELAFGTVDSWLLWNLTAGASHATDFTNASRTMLLDIRAKRWDRELAGVLDVPLGILPEARSSSGPFGTVARGWPLRVGTPILGMAGDQQAALFGQGGEQPGAMKNTYGTGCFLMLNTGERFVASQRGLLTTLCCGPQGRARYALEGAVFISGAAVQWLRDGLGFIKTSAQSEQVAASTRRAEGLVVVPAFTGLGAPHWRADARGAIFGITRATTRAQIVVATLESIALQSCDVLNLMAEEAGLPIRILRVDGGATQNNFLMQLQADLAGVVVERAKRPEATAWGAARLAALAANFGGAAFHQAKGEARRFRPRLRALEREARLATWREAVRKLLA